MNDKTLIGKVDLIGPKVVVGWAITQASGESLFPRLQLTCNGEVISETHQSIFRTDLQDLHGFGHCGFSITIPPTMTPGNFAALSVIEERTGEIIDASEAKVTMLYGGVIEHSSSSLITGYVFDTRPRLTLPCVTLGYEGETVASCRPLFVRRDMYKVLDTDQVWHFALEVPLALRSNVTVASVHFDEKPGLFQRVALSTVSEQISKLAAQYFDVAWYQSYPDLAMVDFSFVDALQHFLAVGFYQNLSPTPLFDAEWYTESVPGLREAIASGQIISAFQHYIDHGLRLLLDPHPLVSHEYIKSTVANLTYEAEAGIIAAIIKGQLPIDIINPLVNDAAQRWVIELQIWSSSIETPSVRFRLQSVVYLYFALIRDRSAPNPRYFDAEWYVTCNPGAGLDSADTVGALSHYFRIGRHKGIDPHPLVSTAFFARRQVSTSIETTARRGLLSILLATDLESIGLNPFTPLWSRSDTPTGSKFMTGEVPNTSPYIDDHWYFTNNLHAKTARDLGSIGSAMEHLMRAQDDDIDDPHPLFARQWYLAMHPDAVTAISTGRSSNAFTYFIEFGQHLGHDPHPAFDSAWYLGRWLNWHRSAAPDGLLSQTAFEYFYSTGRQLDRFPSPYFWIETSADLYLEVLPLEGNSARIDTPYSRFIVFMSYWSTKGFRPNVAFNPRFYAECIRRQNIDISHVRNTFEHYLQIGTQLGVEPNPFFNSIWYSRYYLSNEADGTDAFKHYCAIGSRKGCSPSPMFDEDYYLDAHSDVREGVARKNYINGFAHYCDVGWSENRRTHPFLRPQDASTSATQALSDTHANLDHSVDQVQAEPNSPADLSKVFDETWYITAYPEVAGEMAFFNLPTGFAHYIHFGVGRLRSPGPLFDEAFYLRTNPDLQSALKRGELLSGYFHFCNAVNESRSSHPLLPSEFLLGAMIPNSGLNPAPLPVRRRMAASALDIASTTFTTLAAEFQYWISACNENPMNHRAALQLVICAVQLNDRQSVEHWLPSAQAGKPDPWRSLSLSLIKRCFSIGDYGASEARSAFTRLFKNTEPTFIIEKAFPSEILCGKPTAITIDCVCFHPLHEIVEVEVCIGHRSIPLTSDRLIRYDVFDKHRTTDLLGHSLYSGLNDYIILDDCEPGTTARVVYRMRVQDAFGANHVFSVIAGDIRFVAPPKTVALPVTSNGHQRRIAICMATYQPDLELFAQQIDSIRRQQYSAWTLFISDDASDPEFVRGMLHEIADDPRIVFQPNRMRIGFCKNFERAIGLAGPSYDAFALCDQDDEWFCNKLSVLEAALQGDINLVYSDMEICARDRNTLSSSFWTSRSNYWEDINDVLVANSVTGAACLFHRRVLDLAMPFPDVSGLYHDHWLALCSLALGKIEFIPTALHRYVQHDQNVLGFSNSVKSAFSLKHFRRRYLEIRKLSRTPITALTRVGLNALINAASIHREITRLRALVATIVRRVATIGHGNLNRAALDVLWMTDGGFPTAAALTRIRRQGEAGVRKTLGAEFRLSAALIATEALQRGKAEVVSSVLSFNVAELRSKLVREDASLQTLYHSNAVTWRDHLRSKIRPLVLTEDKAANPSLRVNFLLPELTLSVFFGGYLGKFHLIRKLVDQGIAVRVITLDYYLQDVATFASIEEKYPEFVGLFSEIEIIDRYDRAEGVPLHKKDVFLATTWWSAHVAEDARRRTNKAAFFYLIQEFEPFTFAMGSWYATAMESYSFPHRALFSTDLLQEYFQSENIGVFSTKPTRKASHSFSNAIVSGAGYPVPDKLADASVKGVRRLLFYARPEAHASRNMFEMGIAAIIVAIQKGLFPLDEWEFIGIGSASANFDLHGGAMLQMIGKMGLDDYYRFLQTVDIGLALMFTPHPSLVPLDMASFGIATVTNTCLNKDEKALRAISPNLIPASPTITDIVNGLETARDLVTEQPKAERVGRIEWATTWDEALNDEVMEFVVQSLQQISNESLANPAAIDTPIATPKAAPSRKRI